MDKLMERYKQIIKAISKGFEWLGIASILVMLGVVLIHICMRYFFNAAPGWTEETARQFLIIFCFIGMMIGVRDKLHIALSYVAEGLLKRILLPLEILGKVLIVVLGILMSSFMTPYFTMLKFNRLPGTGLPVSWQYVIPTSMAILMALIAVYQIYDHFKYGTDQQQKELEQKQQEGQK